MIKRLAFPVNDQERSQDVTECSDVGECDSSQGICNCPDGFEGRACERLSCPTSSMVLFLYPTSHIHINIHIHIVIRNLTI